MEADEQLCNRLGYRAEHWLYHNNTKLILLPLQLTVKVYLETPFEAMKVIFNSKSDDYDKRCKSYTKLVVSKRRAGEAEMLEAYGDALKQMRIFLGS